MSALHLSPTLPGLLFPALGVLQFGYGQRAAALLTELRANSAREHRARLLLRLRQTRRMQLLLLLSLALALASFGLLLLERQSAGAAALALAVASMAVSIAPAMAELVAELRQAETLLGELAADQPSSASFTERTDERLPSP